MGHSADVVNPVTSLFENEFFIAVDKPSGLLTVPGREGAADARGCLGTMLSEALGVRLWPVHRLDVPVSGIVLFAKTAEAHREASRWFEGREVHKVYEAWTEGEAPAATAEPVLWKSRLLRGKKRAYESDAGKPSETLARWKVSRPFNGSFVQIWMVEPLTGRSHQLRFELARHGYAVAGDTLYGAKTAFFPDAIALRALELKLPQAAEKFKLPAVIRVMGIAGKFGIGEAP